MTVDQVIEAIRKEEKALIMMGFPKDKIIIARGETELNSFGSIEVLGVQRVTKGSISMNENGVTDMYGIIYLWYSVTCGG